MRKPSAESSGLACEVFRGITYLIMGSQRKLEFKKEGVQRISIQKPLNGRETKLTTEYQPFTKLRVSLNKMTYYLIVTNTLNV